MRATRSFDGLVNFDLISTTGSFQIYLLIAVSAISVASNPGACEKCLGHSKTFQVPI
jgi:hypothetical protein